MKLITYSAFAKSHQPGLLIDDAVYPVPFATMLQLMEAGERGLERARRAADGKRIALADATLHAPLLRPTTLRDAYAFESHVKTANPTDREVPQNGTNSRFLLRNPGTFRAGDRSVSGYTSELDYELESAIGMPGRDITSEDAPKHIFGYTIINDWSARVSVKNESRPRPGKERTASSTRTVHRDPRWALWAPQGGRRL
jgi:2-keto-4-pentenoate hydratase/2-oxohepta-3-ene-1,7-dioic acid hydratase in catechol pathway